MALVLSSELATLASSQHGVISRDQLLAHLSPRQLQRRRETGVLLPFLPLTFLVRGAPPTRQARFHAATLSVPDSVLGMTTAAELHNVRIDPSPELHLIVAGGCRRQLPGVRLRQRDDLARRHRATVDGLAVTTLPRTIIDLACDLRRIELARLLDRLLDARRIDIRVLASEFDALARRGRNGTTTMRHLLEPRLAPLVIERSELERRAAHFLRRHGLPDPVWEFVPPWAGPSVTRVDLAWPDRRVIVELDGRRWHNRTDRFESDRLRDQHAAAHGWVVIRITWRQLHEDGPGVARRLASALDARSAG